MITGQLGWHDDDVDVVVHIGAASWAPESSSQGLGRARNVSHVVQQYTLFVDSIFSVHPSRRLHTLHTVTITFSALCIVLVFVYLQISHYQVHRDNRLSVKQRTDRSENTNLKIQRLGPMTQRMRSQQDTTISNLVQQRVSHFWMKLDWCSLYGLSSTVVTDEKARQSDSCRADIMSDSLKEEYPKFASLRPG